VSESAEAQSAEVYVLAMSVGPVRVSTDLDALKALAEKRQAGAVLATEFKWDPDEWNKDAERVLLYHVSKATGKWNKSGYYIDKVPVLDDGGQAVHTVYSDQEDNEFLGEADPSDPDDWSNR
jgi:hypothetical protein